MSHPKPLHLAITGGIGCGKSATGTALQSLGVAMLDADAVVHDLLARDTVVQTAIRARFGEDVFRDGQVDRRALAAIVFADPAARADLEAVLHPRVRTATDAWLAAQPANQACAVLIPLLYEVGRDVDFPVISCVACSPLLQRERLRQRGWSDLEIDRRLAAQLPLEEKVKRAHVVIWTDGTLANHLEQWRKVLPQLQDRKG